MSSFQLAKGEWQTRCGYRARVVRIVSTAGMFFVASGIIENPHDGTLCIHHWKLDGSSVMPNTNGQLDLVKEAA